MRNLQITPAGAEAILSGAMPSQPHIKVLAAAMVCGVYIVNVIQSKEPFREHKERPTIFLVGDDLGWAVGPDGLHMPSVRRAIRSSVAFSVISCAPLAESYAMSAEMAVARGDNVMIVETLLDYEAVWYDLIQKLAPNKPILLATIKGGRA